MTSGPLSDGPSDGTPSRVRVVGVSSDGLECFAAPLAHGYAPRRVLREGGWRAGQLLRHATDTDGTIIVRYEATAMPGRPQTTTWAPSGAKGLGENVSVVRQRVAAYAVVRSERGVLLTQLSVDTGRPGLWILPGGGVDPGERPEDAVVREVWEESGQNVSVGDLLDVSSSHRIGARRGGQREDFHALRMIFEATCDQPSTPVVHDVGGSTGAAAWYRPHDAADPKSSGYPDGGMAPWTLDLVRKAIAE